MRRTIFLLGMAGAAGASSEAWAQPGSSREDARSRFREAQRLIEAQQWREALPLLREVAKTAETASVRYSIALCEENLGLWREALDDYRAALARANDPVLDAGLKPATRKLLQKESRQSIEALSEKVPVVRVDRLPESDVEASYKLDGQPVESNELLQGVRINPGDHRMRVEAPGKRSLEVAFRMEERSQTVVALPDRLESFEAKPPAPTTPAAPSLTVEPSVGGWRVRAGWVGVGVGAALLGAGVVASLRVDGIGRTQNDERALQHYGSLALMSGYEGRCEAADAGEAFAGQDVASRRRVHRLCSAQGVLRPLQYVFYGAGALLGGVGAYLLLSAEPGAGNARGGARAAQVWVLPGLGPAPLGGSVGGVFLGAPRGRVREGAMMAKQNGGGQELDFSTWVPSERIPGTWYKIHKLVDQGGHGRLYKAEHEITGRVCAVKAIHRKFKTVADLTARLKQEANVNTRLSGHPNIAEVFEAGVTEDGRTYCVMQWLEGANLRTVLKHGAWIDIDWTCFVIKSVLSALARAHSFDIVHRDIKPDNIFLCDDGLVKLIDFGVAKVLNSKFVQTGRGMTPGTIRYMSPEVVDGQTASLASDIYSLGVVFWEMLAGEHPFPQVNQQEAAQCIVRDGVAPLDERPIAVAKTTDALRQVVMCACASDPAERFPSAESFAEAIDQAMGYARAPEPFAAGVYPPSQFGRGLSPRARPAPLAAPAPVRVRGTAPEHSPGTALEVWHPTPRVALTDQAPLSLIVKDSVADAGAAGISAGAHRSSVLMRGQGVDSDQLPPFAPWASKRLGTSSSSGRGGSEFGVLSHVPPFLHQLPDSSAGEERTPSSTPPLVSGTLPRAGAQGAAAEADTSDEATTLPLGGAAGVGRSWWGRALPLGRVAERLRASGTKRAVRTGAGALALALFAFALGQAWKLPWQQGAAAPARLTARGEAPAVASAPLSAAVQTSNPAPSAEAVLPPTPNANATASVGEAAPSPSLADPNAPGAAPATTPKRVGTPAKALEGSQAGASREPRTRTAPPAPRGPRLLPKGGLEPGF